MLNTNILIFSNFLIIADDDSAIVHGVLTEDNLFDGSILTNTENYYIEPAHKYSTKLNARGVHTIVYKASDVHHKPSSIQNEHSSANLNDDEHYCASERLRKKVKNEFKRRRKFSLSDNENVDNVNIKSANIISDRSKNSFNAIAKENGKRRRKRWLPDEVSVKIHFSSFVSCLAFLFLRLLLINFEESSTSSFCVTCSHPNVL